MAEEKLTKKQRKALEFRKKVDKKEKKPEDEHKEEVDEKKKRKLHKEEEKILNDTEKAAAKAAKDNATEASGEEPVKKKRKTRRGKKGKGTGGGPRFLLFVGNLPYDITEPELVVHFKKCSPDTIRIRSDKGIAFLEFSNEAKDIQSRMELGLRKHHSLLRDRKINVELTAGGGGNSSVRVEKIRAKNEKVMDERRDRAKKEGKPDPEDTSGIHPSRLNLMK